MKRILVCLAVFVACKPAPPVVCENITIAPFGPGTGELALCVLPSECRLDTMSQKIADAYCADKSAATCSAATSCSTCVGVTNSSNLKATSCVWDRNRECKMPNGAVGGYCSCPWTIPAGGNVSCGCGCK
jgi:hypothetical protein